MLRMPREGGVKGSCYGVAAYRVRPAAMFSLWVRLNLQPAMKGAVCAWESERREAKTPRAQRGWRAVNLNSHNRMVFWVFFFFFVLYFIPNEHLQARELGASRSNRDHTVRHHRVIYREVSSRNMCLCIKYTSTVRSSRRSVGVILERFLQIIITPRSSERVTVGATSTG